MKRPDKFPMATPVPLYCGRVVDPPIAADAPPPAPPAPAPQPDPSDAPDPPRRAATGTIPPPVVAIGMSRVAEPAMPWHDAAIDGDPPADDAEATPRILLGDAEALFRAQHTTALRQEMERFAAERAAYLIRLGRRGVDRYYIRSVVQNALTDTWLGVVRWDPSRPLRDHVRDVIRRRIWNDSRPRQRREESMHDDPGVLAEVEQVLARERDGADEDDEDDERNDTWHRIRAGLLEVDARLLLVQLRPRVANHAGARPILACWEAGIYERAEILRRTGLTKHQYQVGRRRLKTLAKQLLSELQGGTTHD